MPDRRPSPEPGGGWSIAALAAVTVGALLRLARLDLIEFKGDEQEALNLGIRLLANPPWTALGQLPTHGMPSSQGIANAPLFNWVMAGAWAATGHPVGATALIGLANAAALFPLWRWALRRTDPERALLLIATVAVSPFTVLLSRKLWGQDLLFPALVCLLWAIEYWQQRNAWRAVTCFAIAALPISQLHQSGPIALMVFPIAVAVAAAGDRDGFRERVRDLTRLSAARYGWLLVIAVVYASFWIPYIRYLLSVPLELFLNRPRLDHYEPALLWAVVKQVAPLDLFYFFAPDRLDFLASDWRRFCYSVAVAFGTPLAIAGVWGWARSPNRLPIAGLWWWLVVAVFTVARIPIYPFYVLVLAPLPAALVAGMFDDVRIEGWARQTLMAARWTYVLALLLVTLSLGSWLSERGGARGDYGVVYAVRDRQAAALRHASDFTDAAPRLSCHQPPGEVMWIIERVHRAPAPPGTPAICDGWTNEAGQDRYRWSVRAEP
jgi:hypothetical protein